MTFSFDAGDTGECGWVCPFGKGAHPNTSTHYFVPRGVCRCGHHGDQHPGDGACTSKTGCECDGHQTDAHAIENWSWALEEALREVLRLREALRSVYSVHGPSGLDCECKGCVWYRDDADARPAPMPTEVERCAFVWEPGSERECGRGRDDERHTDEGYFLFHPFIPRHVEHTGVCPTCGYGGEHARMCECERGPLAPRMVKPVGVPGPRSTKRGGAASNSGAHPAPATSTGNEESTSVCAVCGFGSGDDHVSSYPAHPHVPA